jgi:hypothetical protein
VSERDRQETQTTEKGIEMHGSITMERVMAAAEDSMFGLGNPGFCTSCGEDADGCEPDARNYECDCCGERTVFGAEELLMSL